MGSKITETSIPSQNQVLIDWFAFTVKELDPHTVIDSLGLAKIGFAETSGGGMGYKRTLRSGNIVIFYDGTETMGCHVSMTGQGCRQFEQHFPSPNRWLCFFILLDELKATVTRLDIAVDNIDGALDLERLQQCIDDRQIRSRFKKGHIIKNCTFSPTDEIHQGHTIYAGSPQSSLKVRFYDKAAQMEIDGHWTRAELQCRKERAQEAIKHLLKGVDLGHLAISALNHYFQPINIDDSNRSRCTVQAWWRAWTDTTTKLKLSTMKAIKMIDEIIYHVKRQYSASFAMIKKYMGVADFHDFITEMTTTGKQKLLRRHEMIIACSRLMTEPLTNTQAYPF